MGQLAEAAQDVDPKHVVRKEYVSQKITEPIRATLKVVLPVVVVMMLGRREERTSGVVECRQVAKVRSRSHKAI